VTKLKSDPMLLYGNDVHVNIPIESLDSIQQMYGYRAYLTNVLIRIKIAIFSLSKFSKTASKTGVLLIKCNRWAQCLLKSVCKMLDGSLDTF